MTRFDKSSCHCDKADLKVRLASRWASDHSPNSPAANRAIADRPLSPADTDIARPQGAVFHDGVTRCRSAMCSHVTIMCGNAAVINWSLQSDQLSEPGEPHRVDSRARGGTDNPGTLGAPTALVRTPPVRVAEVVACRPVENASCLLHDVLCDPLHLTTKRAPSSSLFIDGVSSGRKGRTLRA